jgi:signal transduction histidine kinase
MRSGVQLQDPCPRSDPAENRKASLGRVATDVRRPAADPPATSPTRLRRLLGRWARLAVGVLLGGGTAALGGVFLLVAGVALVPTLIWPPARRGLVDRISRGVRACVRLDRRWLARWLECEVTHEHGVRRAVGYLLLRVPTGLLGAVLVLAAFVGGVAYLVASVALLGTIPLATAVISVGLGVVGLYLAGHGTVELAALERWQARKLLGPSDQDRLQRRISELAESRAGVVEAVNDERRRIERDLHDGVQQRLVALGMLLGRARRSQSADRTADLLRQAHEQAQQALSDLREVAWRVYPAVLDESGLAAALETVAERCPVPLRIHYGLTSRPTGLLETVAYFVVCEAVTNAAKHAAAELITVDITKRENAITVLIQDNGVGGADPGGGGLSGLARRVAAVDGRFRVHSPVGGPTTINAELPCG